MFLQMRYVGQSSSIAIQLSDIQQACDDFHVAHTQQFGSRLDLAIEIVSIRLALTAKQQRIDIPRQENQGLQQQAKPSHSLEIARSDMAVNETWFGPLIICEDIATTFVEKGWSVHKDLFGHLIIKAI